MTDVQVGDIVQTTRKIKVTSVSNDGWVHGYDVKNTGHRVRICPTGTARVSVLHRPKPKAGDVITGADVKRIPWKRGTIIRLAAPHNYVSALVLTGDGDWRCLDSYDERYTFEQLATDVEFEILHVA